MITKVVANLSGSEFGPVSGYTLRQQICSFYASIGGVAKSAFGDVLGKYLIWPEKKKQVKCVNKQLLSSTIDNLNLLECDNIQGVSVLVYLHPTANRPCKQLSQV